jgi:hypothetical protein
MPVNRLIPMDPVIRRLMESKNVCDQRKARDLRVLQELSRGAWAGRLAPLGVVVRPESGSFVVIVRLAANGLVWRDGAPQPNSVWALALEVPTNYPMAMPGCAFAGEIAYNPHVTHRDFVPDPAGLPAALQQFVRMLRDGGRDGVCCYARHSEWRPDLEHDLARIILQVSRILTGAHVWGEHGSLNNHARDYYLRLGTEGKLPLGPALPFETASAPQDSKEIVLDEPAEEEKPAAEQAPEAKDDDMEWTDDNADNGR